MAVRSPPIMKALPHLARCAPPAPTHRMITPSEILNARILIVDDLQFNLSVLERMLQNAGYTATTF